MLWGQTRKADAKAQTGGGSCEAGQESGMQTAQAGKGASAGPGGYQLSSRVNLDGQSWRRMLQRGHLVTGMLHA